MFMKIMFFSVFMALPLILMIVNIMVSLKTEYSRSLLSSFECGFDSFQNARSSFSLHFFLITIIFLVFDLEIIFLLPMPLYMISSFSTVIIPFSTFLMILFLGILHEWNEGSLKWF